MIINSPGVNFDNVRTDEEIKEVVGDVPKIAIGSYVGTGSGGSSNPNSVTFDFVPKIFMIFGYSTSSGFRSNSDGYNNVRTTNTMLYDLLTTSYQQGSGFANGINTYGYGKRSADGKTWSWYHDSGASYQFNTSGSTYHYIAIG